MCHIIESADHHRNSYGFRFNDGPMDPVCQIRSIGWEERTDTSYNWDNRKRNDFPSYLFQYTISGQGRLEFSGTEYDLWAGDAFLLRLPGDHRYYFPKESERWEFLYVVFAGDRLEEQLTGIQSQLMPACHFKSNTSVVHTILDIYYKAAEKKITDGFQAAGAAYQFLMELCSAAKSYPYDQHNTSAWPEAVQAAAAYLRTYYFRPIGLEEMAEAAGISKYHLARLFHRKTGMTPIQFLTKLRIEKSIELLRNTTFSVEHIAEQVGYANGNYFCKKFRDAVGMSPGQFRSGEDVQPVDYLFFN